MGCDLAWWEVQPGTFVRIYDRRPVGEQQAVAGRCDGMAARRWLPTASAGAEQHGQAGRYAHGHRRGANEVWKPVHGTHNSSLSSTLNSDEARLQERMAAADFKIRASEASLRPPADSAIGRTGCAISTLCSLSRRAVELAEQCPTVRADFVL